MSDSSYKTMTRTEEIYLYHTYMYGDCDCYHCDKYKSENLSSEQSKTDVVMSSQLGFEVNEK